MISNINLHNENLISIRIEEAFTSIFLAKLIEKSFKNMSYLASQNFRPLDTSYLEILRTADLILNTENVLLDKRNYFFSEYIFTVEKNAYSTQITKLITSFWEFYEQNSIIFFLKTDIPQPFINLSASQICTMYKAIVILKGIEENVIWIEKNPLLMFPDIDDIN